LEERQLKLKSAVTTYEISLEELKEHFAEQLKVDKSKIYIEDRKVSQGYGTNEYSSFGGLKITVRDNL
jgi:hypothetical protein